MHALNRPHVPHAPVIAAMAAVVAIVLALALAGSVNDLISTSAGSSTVSRTAARATTAPSGWALSPFAPLSRSGVTLGPGSR